MDLHELSFAKIIILRNDIAEVIVNDEVEMDLKMVDEYHNFLLSHLQPPFSLLINKLNSYSYSFDAQEKLANLNEINAMAVVVYKNITKESTEALVDLKTDGIWNLKIFPNRDDALNWLFVQQKQVNR